MSGALRAEENHPPQVKTTWLPTSATRLIHSHTFLPLFFAEAGPLLSGPDGTVTQKDAIVPRRLSFQPCLVIKEGLHSEGGGGQQPRRWVSR